MSRQLSVRLLAAFLALALGARARADTDRWFRVLLGGSPSGWMHSSEARSGDTITSAGEMSIKVRRGEISIEISMKSEFVETEGGAPVSMKLRQTLGSTPVDSVFTFGPGGIETSTTQDGQTTVATRPLPAGAWLCPAAADRALREAMARGEKEIVLHTIDPMSGMQVLTNTHRVLGEETIQANGAPVKVTRLSVESSAMPGVQSTEYVDASGETVRTDTVLGGIAMSLDRKSVV